MAKTYDPKAVSVIVGGHIVQGFADGTFVSVERSNQTFNLVVGADGEGTRAKSNDKSGTITITLLQSSDSNAVLSGFQQADEQSNAGVVPVLVVDNSGSSLYEAAEAWIQQPPGAEFAKEAGEREWVLETAQLQMFAGGNE